MPIYTASVTSPSQFDGLTADTGLFIPAPNTGGRNIQIRINSILFSGPTGITSWTMSEVNPADGGQTVLTLTETEQPFRAGGPGGFMLMVTNDDGVPWNITWVTTGMVGTGVLTIDWDFEVTEG